MNHIPSVERLHGGRPIVHKIDAHPWENKVTFNPACVLVDDRVMLGALLERLPFDSATKRALGSYSALCFLLYRAQGRQTPSYDYRRSSIGLAVLSPDLTLLARHDKPVILPDQDYENLGVEDGRVFKLDDRYIMFYTAYQSGSAKNNVRIAIASTTDFFTWKKHGLLRGAFNEIDNKNAMLFPGKVNGKYLMLHRPMEGNDALSIHLAESDDLFGVWKSRGVIMKPVPNAGFADTWVGGGAPPLALADGRYLIIYHIGNKKRDGSRVYNLGIAVADPGTQQFIVRRDEPLVRPETAAETTGDADLGVNNVVFICGAYFHQGDLYFPYAGADSVILGGRIRQSELHRYLATSP